MRLNSFMKVSILSCALFSSVTSYSSVPKPEGCPNVIAIQSVVLDQVQPGLRGGWVVANLHNAYGMQENWSFAFVNIKASNAREALWLANQALKSVVNPTGPHPTPGFDAWECTYPHLTGGYPGTATSPALAM